MADSLLLDTHIALALVLGEPLLSRTQRSAIDQCWQSGGTLWISPVTGWEVTLLASKGRIRIGQTPPSWVASLLSRPGVRTAPITMDIALLAYGLAGYPNGDPADRLLVATSIVQATALVTHDRAIQTFARGQGREYGFQVVA